MSHPQQPLPQYGPVPMPPPPAPSKKKRTGLALFVTAAVTAAVAGSCGLAVGGADSATIAGEPAPTVTVTATATTTTTATAPAVAEGEPSTAPTTEEPAPTEFTPKKGDFEVNLKVKRKQCFGSAGCNVTVGIDPKYTGSQDLPDSGTIEVTYEISGDESGPVTNTFTVEGGQASYTAEEDISTPSAGTKVKAKITDVSYDDN